MYGSPQTLILMHRRDIENKFISCKTVFLVISEPHMYQANNTLFPNKNNDKRPFILRTANHQ